MEHIFSIGKSRGSGELWRQSVFESLICSVSNTNIVAFTTEKDLDNSQTWGCHVYVADLNTPWFVHKVLSNRVQVTVLQWDATGNLLLIADENGTINIFRSSDYVLNEWNQVVKTELPGENILAAVFFHNGKKIGLNVERKDSLYYPEKFSHIKLACSVKKFGGRPANGVLLLTTTGLLATVLLCHSTNQVLTTESLGPTRSYVKTADICYGKNGHFLIAASSGNINLPIQCYKVQVRKVEEKCVISSQSLPSFFIMEGGKEALRDFMSEVSPLQIYHIKWLMREDADSLVVSTCNDNGSCLQVWELREKAIPIHKLFAGSELKSFNTVVWQYQSNFQYNYKVTSVATSKLNITNNSSSWYIVTSYEDNSIRCLYCDSLQLVANITLNLNNRKQFDEPSSKQFKSSIRLTYLDLSWLGNLLMAIDSEGYLHLFKLPPQIEGSGALSVPYGITLLEYCLVTGLDWLDLLLTVRSNMIDALSERITESFNRQSPATQQFLYVQYLCIKISLYRLSNQGQGKVNDLTQLLMLHGIATSFKSLLRPSEMGSHDKSPADSLANVIAEGQNDVDKLLMHLEAKEFTVEPSTLQSLQQLIQWIADLALNLLVRLPESRPSGKSYDLLHDIRALNTLREMLVLIRIWGLLRPACLPVFNKSDPGLDVLAVVFRYLGRLVQSVNEPDESLIDDCCLLPNQVQIQPLINYSHKIALASPQFFQQQFPLQMEYQVEPDCLANTSDFNGGQVVDSVRHLYLGMMPRTLKQCVRCGSATGIGPVTRTAALRAWDQRWARSCQCGGLWRVTLSEKNKKPVINI